MAKTLTSYRYLAPIKHGLCDPVTFELLDHFLKWIELNCKGHVNTDIETIDFDDHNKELIFRMAFEFNEDKALYLLTYGDKANIRQYMISHCPYVI